MKSSSTKPCVKPQPVPKVGKAERTRAAILNAALDFVWSHHFRDLTVGQLMSATGHSRAAFYQYFGGLHDLMEALLGLIEGEILAAADPWFTGTGDPVVLLRESLTGLVEVSYRQGPILRATAEAAPNDKRLEKTWAQFLERFDEAVAARIEADQHQDLIAKFDARPVAVALNRLDAYTLIDNFGRRPRSKREPVLQALERLWISSLYGSEWVGKEKSGLTRT